MTLSTDLVALTDDHLPAIEAHPAMQAMLSAQLDRQQYADFLVRLYPVVSHFCPLMAAAAGRCADRYPDLRRFLYEHLNEERGHEAMVLSDLRALGIDASRVPLRRPVAPVQMMLAFNYHAIADEHPACVLGLIYVLEMMSSLYGGKIAQVLSRSLNLSLATAFSFLDSHASLDEDHMAELRKLLQQAECTAASSTILNSIDVNFHLFAGFLSHTAARPDIWQTDRLAVSVA